eukprot:CAMPEP_0197517222 /NCGR_PEP_ID=MMETSP1318-20131121/2202_1 /TAXON_ID=552666 /ORGANISM="Partenskyella glossopodia, Strain RCC365" /LENGTH=246 /DNA_ID=CAMNT_0043066613 /DNA_START=46 /DNA_END=786 /DNA_ORIENTATION=+
MQAPRPFLIFSSLLLLGPSSASPVTPVSSRLMRSIHTLSALRRVSDGCSKARSGSAGVSVRKLGAMTAEPEDATDRRTVIHGYWSKKCRWALTDELQRMGIKYKQEDDTSLLLNKLVDEITALSTKYSGMKPQDKDAEEVVATVAWKEVMDEKISEEVYKRRKEQMLKERIEGKVKSCAAPSQKLTDIWEREQQNRKRSRTDEFARAMAESARAARAAEKTRIYYINWDEEDKGPFDDDVDGYFIL